MNSFIDALKVEQNRIQRLITLSGKFEEDETTGLLLLEKHGDKTYCYERRTGTDRKRHKTYLGTPDSPKAKTRLKTRFLREKHRRLLYDQTLLAEVERQYQDYGFEAIMSALPNSYRTISQEDFNNARYEEVKAWANADYPKNTAPFPEAEIYTRDGLRVRSKGECLLANILRELGVPYRYDGIHTITDGYGNTREVSPDFEIECLDRSHIIIEHLGKLYDQGYALKFGEKCYWYLQEGFILGKNFFVTSDDIHGGTDSQAIWCVAMEVQRLFYGY